MTGLSIAILPAGIEIAAVAEPGAVDPALATMFAGLLAGNNAPPAKAPTLPVTALPIMPTAAEDAPSGGENVRVGDESSDPTDPVLNLPILGAPPLVPVRFVAAPPPPPAAAGTMRFTVPPTAAQDTKTLAPPPVGTPQGSPGASAPIALSLTSAAKRPAQPTSSLTIAEGMPIPPPAPLAPPHDPFVMATPVQAQPIAIDGPIAPRAGFGGRRPIVTLPVEKPPVAPPPATKPSVVTSPGAAPLAAPPVGTTVPSGPTDSPSPAVPGTRIPMQPSPDMPDFLPEPDEPPVEPAEPPLASPVPIAIDGPLRPAKFKPVRGAPDVPDNVVTVQDAPAVDLPDAPPPSVPAPVVAADAPDLVLIAKDRPGPAAADGRQPPIVAADAPDLVLIAQEPQPAGPVPLQGTPDPANVSRVASGWTPILTSPQSPAAFPATDQPVPAPVVTGAGVAAPTPFDARPGRTTAVKTERGVEPPAVAATPAEPAALRRTGRSVVDTRSFDIAAAPQPAAPAVLPDQAVAGLATPLADRVVAHRLDMAAGDGWLDQLARDIALTAGNEAQLKFRLNPEHLGSLQVELRHTAEGASVRLSADTEAARAILADARPRLLAEAQSQGVRIADAQISGGGGHSRQGEGHRPQPQVTPQPARAGPRNIAAVTVNEPIGAIAERYA